MADFRRQAGLHCSAGTEGNATSVDRVDGMSLRMVCDVVATVAVEGGKFGKNSTAFGADAFYRRLVDIAAADKKGIDAEIAKAKALCPEATMWPNTP